MSESVQQRIGFLFNHETLHQVAHCAPLIAELKRICPELDLTVMASSDAQLEQVRRHMEPPLTEGLSLVRLDTSTAVEWVDRLTRHVAPFRRVAVLQSNLDTFRRFDVLIVPETFSLILKTRFGLEDLRFVYTHHGAGDRSIGFTREHGMLDFVLVPGKKIRDRLLSRGLLREGDFAVVGYPKFDAFAATNGTRRRFFENDNPVVLYNPHFEPRLSSWYEMGDRVLDYFARTPEFNLIFAPHVMLFHRRLHTTPENWGFRLRRGLSARHRAHGNILIDLGGEACVDMTYTMNADVYIGDASSQVYEFLLEPRPCIFLNGHGARWRGDPDYRHWTAGPVLNDPKDIDTALRSAWADHQEYRPIQEKLFADTFDLSSVPSTRRGAEAIAAYLARVR